MTIRSLSWHTTGASAVAVSPDGSVYLTGDHSGSVRAYRSEDHAFIGRFKAHNKPIARLVFLPDNRLVTVTESLVRLWDWSTQEHLNTVHLGRPAVPSTFCVLPDLKAAVSLEKGGFAVIDFSSTQPLKIVTCVQATRLFSLPDGRLLSLGAEGTAQVLRWESETVEFSFRVFKPSKKYNPDLSASCVLPDGTFAFAYRNEIIIFDVNTGKSLVALNGHNEEIFHLSPLPHNRLLSCSKDGDAKIWDGSSGSVAKSFRGECTKSFTSLCPHPAGYLLVISSPSFSIVAVEIDGEPKETVLHPALFDTDKAQLVAGGGLVTKSARHINFIDLKTGRCLRSVETENAKDIIPLRGSDFFGISVSSDFAGIYSKLRIYGWGLEEPLTTLPTDDTKPTAERWIPLESGQVLSYSYYNPIIIHDPSTGGVVKTLPGNCGLACHLPGNRVATVTAFARNGLDTAIESTLSIIDLGSGEVIHSFEVIRDKVEHLVALPNNRLAALGGRKTLYVFDTIAFKQVAREMDFVQHQVSSMFPVLNFLYLFQGAFLRIFSLENFKEIKSFPGLGMPIFSQRRRLGGIVKYRSAFLVQEPWEYMRLFFLARKATIPTASSSKPNLFKDLPLPLLPAVASYLTHFLHADLFAAAKSTLTAPTSDEEKPTRESDAPDVAPPKAVAPARKPQKKSNVADVLRGCAVIM